MTKPITKLSAVSRSNTLVIDNFNSNTNSCVYIERVEYMPFFRVVKRNIQTGKTHECFYLDEESANQYFSQLMAEQLELF